MADNGAHGEEPVVFRPSRGKVRTMLVVGVVSKLAEGLVVFLVARFTALAPVVALLVFLGLSGLELLSFWNYRIGVITTRISVLDGKLEISRGRLLKRRDFVYLDKVYSIERKQGPVNAHFGLADLGVRTIDEYFDIKGLTSADARACLGLLESAIHERQ